MTETLHDNKTLTELPRHTFVGPNREANYAIDIATPFMEAPSRAIPFFPEALKTPEELQILSEMNSAVTEYAQDLGVDINSRLPNPDDILLYSEDEFEKLRVALDKSEGWGGGWLSPNILATHPSLKNGKKMSVLGHELIHSVGFTGTRVSYKDSNTTTYVDQTRRGYAVAKDLAFNMLDEGVVEMMSREVAEKYWPNYALLQQTAYNYTGYSSDMPVVGAMIDKMAEKLGKSKDEVWKPLAKGELTGDMKALRQFVDAYGYEGMKTIAEYKKFGAESAGRVALQLGLDIKPPQE